jgi:hypothetical protein
MIATLTFIFMVVVVVAVILYDASNAVCEAYDIHSLSDVKNAWYCMRYRYANCTNLCRTIDLYKWCYEYNVNSILDATQYHVIKSSNFKKYQALHIDRIMSGIRHDITIGDLRFKKQEDVVLFNLTFDNTMNTRV